VFERFTDRARKVLVDAQQHAIGLGHEYLGCEHILLGLTMGDGVSAVVLTELGVTTDRVRAAIVELVGENPHAPLSEADALAALGIDLVEVRTRLEAAFGEGALPDRDPLQPPFTPKAKALLERSLQESLGLGHGYIGTEHLLLAVIVGDGNYAEKILEGLGVEQATMRSRVLELAARDALRIRAAEAKLVRFLPQLGDDDVDETKAALRAIAKDAMQDAGEARSRQSKALAAATKVFADELEAALAKANAALQSRGLTLGE
jgi:ATP-dependent Clp protease ATP-binding subunit ClpA